MQTNKTVARVVGVLFIAATAFAVIGDRLLRPIRDDDNYLSTLAEHEGRVIIGALTEVSLAVSVVAIAVLLFPVLKRAGEGSALGVRRGSGPRRSNHHRRRGELASALDAQREIRRSRR